MYYIVPQEARAAHHQSKRQFEITYWTSPTLSYPLQPRLSTIITKAMATLRFEQPYQAAEFLYKPSIVCNPLLYTIMSLRNLLFHLPPSLKPPQLLRPHPLIILHPLRRQPPSLRRRPKLEPLLPQRLQRLLLHQAILLLILSIKLERFFQRHRRVRDNPRNPQVVLRGRVQHERVKEYNVAHFTRAFDEVVAPFDFFEVRPVFWVVLWVGVG